MTNPCKECIVNTMCLDPCDLLRNYLWKRFKEEVDVIVGDKELDESSRSYRQYQIKGHSSIHYSLSKAFRKILLEIKHNE